MTDVETQRKSLLLVHGRDFKPSADVFMELSLQALRLGVERDYPDCVPCFDALHKDQAWYGDLNAEILQKDGRPYDEELDIGDRRNVLQTLSQVTPRKKFGIRLYDSLPGKSALPEFCITVLAHLLALIGARLPLLARLSRDFRAYFDNDGRYAEQTRARLRAKLCELMDRGDQIMLITHGTGSVIAYDVLWELSNDTAVYEEYGACKVDQWLTLGSPLGDRVVQKRLLGARERGDSRFPGNVISWHNLSAEDDYTCLDNTLADDFRKMMQQRRVSAVHDYQVFNLAVRYGKSNPHSSLGYLIHPRVSKIIADWIR